MVVLVILDGASEPFDGGRPTSLERARTPTLDRLARTGVLTRARTVATGLPAGSETAIPALLGWKPTGPVDRGAIEAAAHGLPAGRRVDVLDAGGARAGDEATARVARALGAHRIGGHRLLLAGRGPVPEAAHLRVWPGGAVPPRILDARTVVVAARGAAAGVARLMGARVVVPAGATGDPSSDLAAKATAALTADAEWVVVHLGGADEAAHNRDRAGKVAFLERADREVIAPLAAAIERAGGTLRVCPDHGCDPATGAHDAHPVPHLCWDPGGTGADDAHPVPHLSWDPGGTGAHDAHPVPHLSWGGGRRLCERAVAGLPVSDL